MTQLLCLGLLGIAACSTLPLAVGLALARIRRG
jgi:hypothetical protein